MAEFCSVGDAVDTAPDDFLSAVDVPSYTLIRAATLSAVQPFGKGVLAVVPPAFFLALVCTGLAVAAGDFSLNLAVHLLGDDAFVIVLNVVLRQLAGVFLRAAGQHIVGKGLLQQDITAVFLDRKSVV